MDELLRKISKYNFWDGKLPPLGFERRDYLSMISQYTGNQLVKVLIGQRRVGKSYILRQIIKHLIKEQGVNPKNIFYLNKEFLAFDEIKTGTDLKNLFEYYKKELNITGKI